MEIRTARTEDLSAIAALYELLFRESAALQPHLWRPAAMPESFLQELIGGKNSDILVLTEEERVIGFAVLQQKNTLPFDCVRPGRYGYLMDLVVETAQRGKGFGTCLLKAAEEWARGRGLAWLELNVLEKNTGAMRLYERFGMHSDQRLMRKML